MDLRNKRILLQIRCYCAESKLIEHDCAKFDSAHPAMQNQIWFCTFWFCAVNEMKNIQFCHKNRQFCLLFPHEFLSNQAQKNQIMRTPWQKIVSSRLSHEESRFSDHSRMLLPWVLCTRGRNILSWSENLDSSLESVKKLIILHAAQPVSKSS